MDEAQIVECNKDDAVAIVDGLVTYNAEQVQFTQQPPFENLRFKIVIDGTLAGGILGEMYCWHCLHIDILFVFPRFRNRGYGKLLLRYMEDFALCKNCFLIHLDTFDFQAKAFYERQGYSVFGVLEDCPPGHKRFYLKRVLGKAER